MTLTELAERAEKATGPDEQLDRDIFAGIGGSGEPLDPWAGFQAFTASIDAAMSLVPEGWEALIASTDHATVRKSGGGKACRAERCATPVLALVAAALRAREAK